MEDVPDATPAAADAEDSGSEDESDDEEADDEEGFVFRPVGPGHPPPGEGRGQMTKALPTGAGRS